MITLTRRPKISGALVTAREIAAGDRTAQRRVVVVYEGQQNTANISSEDQIRTLFDDVRCFIYRSTYLAREDSRVAVAVRPIYETC